MPNYTDSAPRALNEKIGEQPSILDYPATPPRVVADGASITDAEITSGSATLTSATAPWTAGDVGKLALVRGAGTGGLDLCTTISAFVSAGEVTLAASAGSTVTGGAALWGSDNQAGIQAAVDSACAGTRPGVLKIPRGTYLVGGSIELRHASTIEGEGYTSYSEISGGPTVPPSRIVGVGAFPVFVAAQTPSYAVSIREVAIQGSVVAGSKGIYAAEAWDWCIDRCFLEYFGGQAIHIASGVVAHIRRNFVQNAVMIRSGHSAWIGAVDLQVTDAEIADNNLNASIVTTATTGYIAACVLRWPNCFVRHNQFAQSDVGFVATAAAAYGSYMGNRADLNRRDGFVVECGDSRWVGNWAFRNSRDSDGSYDGFKVSGAGNVFLGNQVLGLDADVIRHRHAFNDISAVGIDDSFANTYNGNHFRCATGSLYNFTGATTKRMALEYTPANGQQNPENPADHLFWDTTYHRLGIGGDGPYDTLHLQGDAAGKGRIRIDAPYPRLMLLDRAAAADNKKFDLIGNAGQLLGRVINDADSSADTWLLVTRTGAVVGYVAWPRPIVCGSTVGLGTTDKVQVMGNIGLQDGGAIYFGSARAQILSYAGDPEGAVAAVGGSICMYPAGGAVYYKASGVSTTGWKRIAGGALTGESLSLDSATAFIRLLKSGVLKFEVDADGVITVLPHVAAPVLSKAANAALEVQTAAGVSKFKVDTSAATIGVAATFSAAPILSSLTDSLPLKLNGSKAVISEKIDLSDSGDVAATGVSTGQVLSWNGAATIGLNIGTGSLDVAAGNHTHTGFALAGVSAANSVVLAKLTSGGSNGQIVWNNDGQITSVTDPT